MLEQLLGIKTIVVVYMVELRMSHIIIVIAMYREFIQFGIGWYSQEFIENNATPGVPKLKWE